MRRLLAILLLVGATGAQDKELELPTRKSVILSRGPRTYYVEGRQRIPWGCEISCSKEITIVGRGADATLVVAGAFLVRGITDRLSTIDNLRIEPDESFQEIRFDMVDMKNGGGIFIDKEKPCQGNITLESTEVQSGVRIDLTLMRGEVRFLNSMFREEVTIRGVPPEGKSKSQLRVNLIGNYLKAGRVGAVEERSPYSGFLSGLHVSGGYKTVIRNNRIAGDKAVFIDCPGLEFDGNKVDARRLEIRCTENGGFRRTSIQKCDIYSSEVVLHAPAGPKKERVVIDKCWFRGLAKEDEIQEKVITDGHDAEDCGVYARFRKINDKPLELAGRAQ